MVPIVCPTFYLPRLDYLVPTQAYPLDLYRKIELTPPI